MSKSSYTNRQRRNNLVRSMCVRLVRERMPEAYKILLAKAERIYRNQRPDMGGSRGAEQNHQSAGR